MPARRKPAASPNVVVFPAPLGPTSPWQLPVRTWKLTRSRASVVPYRFDTPSRMSAASTVTRSLTRNAAQATARNTAPNTP